MRHKLIISLLFLGASLLPVHAQANPLPPEVPPVLGENEKHKLENGKITFLIEELSNADILVKAILLFDKPPGRCWEIMTESGEQKEYIKNIAWMETKVISPVEEHTEYLIQWLFIKKKFKLIHVYDRENLYMNWHLDPAYNNELDAHTGYWKLFPYQGNRTLAVYADNMALPGLPHWLENLVKKEVVKRTMLEIKKFIDR